MTVVPVIVAICTVWLHLTNEIEGICRLRIPDNGNKVLLLSTEEIVKTVCSSGYLPDRYYYFDTSKCLGGGEMFSWTVCKNSCTAEVIHGTLFSENELTGDPEVFNGSKVVKDDYTYVLQLQCDKDYFIVDINMDRFENNRFIFCYSYEEGYYNVLLKRLECRKRCDLSKLYLNPSLILGINDYTAQTDALSGVPTSVACETGFGFDIPANPSTAIINCDSDGKVFTFDAETKCKSYHRELVVFGGPSDTVVVKLVFSDNPSSVTETVMITGDYFGDYMSEAHCGRYLGRIIYIEMGIDQSSDFLYFYNPKSNSFENSVNKETHGTGDHKFLLSDADSEKILAGIYFLVLFGGPYRDSYVICCGRDPSNEDGMLLLMIDAENMAAGISASYASRDLQLSPAFKPLCGALFGNKIIIIGEAGAVWFTSLDSQNTTVTMPNIAAFESCSAATMDDELYVCGRELASPLDIRCHILRNYPVVNETTNIIDNYFKWETENMNIFENTNLTAMTTISFDLNKRYLSLLISKDGQIKLHEDGMGGMSQEFDLHNVTVDSKCIVDNSFKPYWGPVIMIVGGKSLENSSCSSRETVRRQSIINFYPNSPWHSRLIDAEMTTPRYYAACHKEDFEYLNIVCCGGKSTETGEVLRYCEKYSFTNRRWSLMNYNTIRHYMATPVFFSTAYYQTLYCGGLDAHGNAVGSCHSRDVDLILTNPSVIRKLSCFGKVGRYGNEYVLAFGGTEHSGGVSSRVDVFDGSNWDRFPHDTRNSYNICSAKYFKVTVNFDTNEEESMMLVCGFQSETLVECERFLPEHPEMGFHSAGSFRTSTPTAMKPGNVQIDVATIFSRWRQYDVVYAAFGNDVVKYDVHWNEWIRVGTIPGNLGIESREGWSFLVFEYEGTIPGNAVVNE